MFENTIAYKRIMKRKLLAEAVEKAKEEGIDWKIRQSEGKLACFDGKYYPKVLWDSAKGTYRKPKEA